jgi:hypothetical protein
MPNMNIEQIDWFKEFIEFFSAFLATTLGVFLAFKLDRWRERANLRVKKLKLIQLLIDELDYLTVYIRKNPDLVFLLDYRLQTDVIDETIKDQLELFDQKTNKLLKLVRLRTILQSDDLEEWTELNKSAVGTGKYPTKNTGYNAEDIRLYWKKFIVEIRPLVKELKKDLEREKVKANLIVLFL